MTKWWVQHYADAYKDHPRWIGKEDKYKGKISKIKKGDEIVYYIPDPLMAITGLFKVTSNIKKLKDDPHWKGLHWVYDIEPIVKTDPPFLPVNDMLEDFKKKAIPFRFFKNYKMSGIKLKGRTAIEMEDDDFEAIKSYLESYKPPKFFEDYVNDEELGEPKELKVMRFTPTSHDGVVALFVEFRRALGFPSFEFIRGAFPDACAYEKTKRGVSRKYIEFEVKSSDFKEHIKTPAHRKLKCDYVVCWEDDFPFCPVEVIELRKKIPMIIEKLKEK